jgi:hypothetical protein
MRCSPSLDVAKANRLLLLPIHVGEAKRLLPVVFDFQLILLVELDPAEGRKLASPFAILVHVEY